MLLCELEDLSERVERVLASDRVPLEVADVVVRREHNLHRAGEERESDLVLIVLLRLYLLRAYFSGTVRGGRRREPGEW